jgi:hypothetical protein
MGKKSQITVYIIIGILVIAAFGIVLFNSGRPDDAGFPDKTIGMTTEFVDNRMDDCLNDIIIETIDKEGLCSDIPFESMIKENLFSCINMTYLKMQGFTIAMKTKPQKVNVTLTEEEIVANVEYPIFIRKGETKVEFFSREFTLPRTRSLSIMLDDSGRASSEQYLMSSDLDLELRIPKGTKVSGSDSVSVKIEEICPDDPSVLGKVKYVFTPDRMEFEPNAFLTIRYGDKDVSKLSNEAEFKLAFLDRDHWEIVSSSSDVDMKKIEASTTHLSDWVASCQGTNKYGMQLMFSDLVREGYRSNVDSDLKCAANFSGPCGYAKIVVYLDPLTDDHLEFYEKVFNQTYAQHLVPVVTMKTVPLPEENPLHNFYSHPGNCDDVPNFCKHDEYLTEDIRCGSYSLNCFYGEDEDGTNKPVYDYGTKTSENTPVEQILKLLDRVHKDKPEWPIYLEVGDEPNLAVEWHNVSLTDYEIGEYARYYASIAKAVKEDLDSYSGVMHSGSIELMPAGLAPTSGMKECRLSPRYSKQYDDKPQTHKIFEDGVAYMSKADCDLLKDLPEYMDGNSNLCIGESLPAYSVSCPAAGDCKSGDDPCTSTYTAEDIAACVCPAKEAYIAQVAAWYEGYENRGMGHVFEDLEDEYSSLESYTCDASSYLSDEEVGYADLIKARIAETFQTYCFEKITEVEPKQFLNAILIYNAKEMCEYIDLYADHSYPAQSMLESYPGGADPFGADAYVSRFNLVTSICEGFGELECTSVDRTDTDSDGIFDYKDNCPYVSNPDQADWDKWMGEGLGDKCDDSDGDGVMDSEDTCPLDPSIKDGTLEDVDEDGFPDVCDNCPYVFNPDQKDTNGNSVGDHCEDIDGDGIPNISPGKVCKKADLGNEGCIIDNCPSVVNPDQYDEDSDLFGNACDNCDNYPNPEQWDYDNDGEGYPCDEDDYDVCPSVPGIQNDEDDCPPSELCRGKIFLTEVAWGPHPKNIFNGPIDFDVDSYVSQMEKAFDSWTEDKRILGIISYHVGDEGVAPEDLMDYSWTKEMCADTCVGKDIFNIISKKTSPQTSCSGSDYNTSAGNKVLLQNLGKEVGPNRIVYTCFKPDGNPVGGTEQSFKVGNIEYVYKGIKECFEEKGDGEGISLEEYCPDSDGTVREGILCTNVTIGEDTYIGLVRCKPSLDSDLAMVMKCGLKSDCDAAGGCCESGGEYGRWWHACKKVEHQPEEGCKSDDDCELGYVCEDSECITEDLICIPDCEEGYECDEGICNKICPECEEGTHCSEGECMPDVCDPGCSDAQECIGGVCIYVCEPLCADEEVCFEGICEECIVNADCDITEICEDKACVDPGCQFDAECDQNQYCDAGICRDECLVEGELVPAMSNPPPCCEGLVRIDPPEEYITWILGICTGNCGNGQCDSTETHYNCPADC